MLSVQKSVNPFSSKSYLSECDVPWQVQGQPLHYRRQLRLTMGFRFRLRLLLILLGSREGGAQGDRSHHFKHPANRRKVCLTTDVWVYWRCWKAEWTVKKFKVKFTETFLVVCIRLPSRRKPEASVPLAESSEARQKFSNAKAISSDMFFGRESNAEVRQHESSFHVHSYTAGK